MTLHTWIDWCQKQLGDLSLRLFRQGYHPARIEYLNQTAPLFQKRFQGFMNQINEIMDQMAANPEGYHHFEDFTKAKMELLEFTSHHRAIFLDLDFTRRQSRSGEMRVEGLAQTA